MPTSNLTITLNDNNGLLNVTSTNGVIVTGGGKSPSNSLTLTGSLSSLNGILATLTDSNNKLGNDNITASVSDSLTGLSYTCQLSINVASPLSIKTDSNIIGQGITTKIKNILIASNANENTNIVLTVSDLKGLLSVTPTNLTMLPNTEVVKLMGALFGVEAGSATTNIVMIDVVKGGLVNAFSSYYTAAFGNTTTAAVASSILTNIGVIAGQNGLTVQQVTDQTAYLTGKINASPPSSRVETIMSYLELWSTVDSDPTFGAIYGAASKAWNAAISLAVQYASSGKQDLHFTVSNITSIPTPISVTPTTSIPISSINVNVVGNNSNTITLYGSLSGVNSTLATLTDTNTSLGPDNLNISVEDFTSGLVTTAIDLVTVKPQISISGTLAGQTNTDAPSNLPIKPFSKLIISDLDPSLIQTATITLSSPGNGVLSNLGNGSYDNARGIYTVSGLPSVVTSTIQKLTFIPTPHLVAPKSSFTTTFTVTDVDSIIQPKVNISDFAGSGVMGKTDGQSLSATFTEPIGLFVDHKGNVLIAGGGAIRQISPSGIVSTPTSKDFFSWPSAVTEDSSGNLYVTDSSVQTNPASIAIGPGGNQIYKVSPTGQITTFAGSTTHGNTNGNGANASFNSPTGIVMDAKGNLFVADNLNNEIRKITPSGDVTTFAGSGLRGNVDGVGSNASFYLPDQLAIDSSGNIYVGDNGNREIRKISPDGNVTTIARGLDDPRGVAVDSIGNVYFSEYSTNAIKKIDLSGIITTVASSPNVATLSNVSILDIKLPDQVAIDSYGNLLVANRGNNDILKISLNTTPIASDSKTSVITTVSISPITVSGVSSTPVTTTDAIKVSPFTNLTILDPNAAQTETVTITLSSSANGVLTNTGSGTFNGNTGVYSVSGTIDSVNKEIQELIFTPAPHQLSPGKTQTTTFTLKVVDTCGETFTVIPTKVNSTANTTVPIKSSGSFSGANGTTSFLIDSGNYSTTITGFKNGDSIKFNFLNAAVTLNNSSSTDGLLNITSTDPANHNQVIIHLTGISAPQDASISNLVNFNSAIGFGLGSLS